jgi:hypothetical protein
MVPFFKCHGLSILSLASNPRHLGLQVGSAQRGHQSLVYAVHLITRLAVSSSPAGTSLVLKRTIQRSLQDLVMKDRNADEAKMTFEDVHKRQLFQTRVIFIWNSETIHISLATNSSLNNQKSFARGATSGSE